MYGYRGEIAMFCKLLAYVLHFPDICRIVHVLAAPLAKTLAGMFCIVCRHAKGAPVRSVITKAATQQFAKFAVVGIVSFAVDWLLLIVLVEGFHMDYLLGTSISFLASVALNYALSMRFVFEHRDDMSRKREFTIFAILSAIGLALTDALMFVGVTVLGVVYQVMKIVATFCVTWYNFFSRKKFLAS